MNRRGKTYATWGEASAAVKRLEIKDRDDYQIRYDKLDPLLPSNPQVFYKGTFPGWKIFIGNEFYKTWKKSRDISILFGVTNWKEYEELRRKNPKLRSKPADIYSDFVSYRNAFDPFSITNFFVDYINLSLLEIIEIQVPSKPKEILEFSMSY